MGFFFFPLSCSGYFFVSWNLLTNCFPENCWSLLSAFFLIFSRRKLSKVSLVFFLPYLCPCNCRFLSSAVCFREIKLVFVFLKKLGLCGEWEGWNTNPSVEINQPNRKTYPNVVFTSKTAVMLHKAENPESFLVVLPWLGQLNEVELWKLAYAEPKSIWFSCSNRKKNLLL